LYSHEAYFKAHTSSQKVSKNPKIYSIYSSLSKNEKSCFGSLRTLGVKMEGHFEISREKVP
jgi:hypothetical protein